jgi:hypothetical protein
MITTYFAILKNLFLALKTGFFVDYEMIAVFDVISVMSLCFTLQAFLFRAM